MKCPKKYQECPKKYQLCPFSKENRRDIFIMHKGMRVEQKQDNKPECIFHLQMNMVLRLRLRLSANDVLGAEPFLMPSIIWMENDDSKFKTINEKEESSGVGSALES